MPSSRARRRLRLLASALAFLVAPRIAVAQPLPPDPVPPPPAEVAGVEPVAGTEPAPAKPPPAKPGADGTPLNDYWRNGLRFESRDKEFSLFVGGRFQFDEVQYLTSRAVRGSVPGTVPLEDGVSFRRVRLDMGGTIYKNIEFYTQVDFANAFQAAPGASRSRLCPRPSGMRASK